MINSRKAAGGNTERRAYRAHVHWWVWLLSAGVALAGAYVWIGPRGGTSSRAAAQGPSGPPQSVPVVTAAVKKGDIGIFLTGLGTVTPLNTVTVKTRVDGELRKVFFQEGQIVNSGAPLAEIDSRPFDAQLTQAEGQLIRDQALLDNARLDLQRYEILARQDSIAKQQYDTQKSLVHQLEGTVKFDQGQVDAAKVQIAYCHITTPVVGRVGLRVVDPGNIVHAADATGIVVVTQLQPITVIFPIAQDSIQAVLPKLEAGEKLPVYAYDRDQRKKLATGTLLTIDNQVDPTTGTVRFKATFPNKDNKLFPNQFVNASLLLDTKKDTNIIPTAALQRSSQGTFVFLVKEDQTVTVRSVKAGVAEGDNVSIDEGLSVGDLVVIGGMERLREGSKVEVRNQGTVASQKGS